MTNANNTKKRKLKLKLPGTLLACKLLLLLHSKLLAQPNIPSYPFVNHELNVITDKDSSLNRVLKSLYQLKQDTSDKQTAVSILHIGDSHLQAGFISGVLRPSLQKEFGNAGRGLITPYRLAKTNEPRGYNIQSNSKLTGGRFVSRKLPMSFGMTGIAIESADRDFSLRLEARPDSSFLLDYSFNRVIVLHSNAPAMVPENLGLSYQYLQQGLNAYSLKLNRSMSSLWLQNADTSQQARTIHGFSLENGQPGILYHMVGVNGATFLDYCNLSLLADQSKELKPQLIIISLGTNESIGNAFNKVQFTDQVDCLVRRLQKANPQAAFILTTPAEAYRRSQRKRIPNTRIELVRGALIEYAESHKLAYWDLFMATGGKGSCEKWKKAGLLGYDQLHFSVQGYELQGQLLYDAIMKLYYTYAKQH